MKIIITGGAGFIGINAARYFAETGREVVIFDNFSRVGADENVQWLLGEWPKVEVVRGDVRNVVDCERFFRVHADASLVLHLAGQVAVTRSVADPREDFESNALGTLNVLEAVRRACPDCVLIYSSTNKVYGGLEGVPVVSEERRYFLDGYDSGIPETFPLDFHSPYGCSKGCADQYVRDYARIYGLKTVVFRQSCIYGYRQFGVEDQGWVAWFTIASVAGKPITVYGDGKQVRDILFIDDLVKAYEMAFDRIDRTSGRVYNIGGGPSRAVSVLEVLDMLGTVLGKKIDVCFSDWRPGDQRIYVSDISRAKVDFGWEPMVSVTAGIERLAEWVIRNQAEISSKVGVSR